MLNSNLNPAEQHYYPDVPHSRRLLHIKCCIIYADNKVSHYGTALNVECFVFRQCFFPLSRCLGGRKWDFPAKSLIRFTGLSFVYSIETQL